MPSTKKPGRGSKRRAADSARAKAQARRIAKRIQDKREHRVRLAAEATAHWVRLGDAERRQYLKRVREALEAEGFRSTLLQWRHKGHAFGLVRNLGDKQVHVRVYENGVIDAEVEIHKRFVEHIFSPRPSAHRTVQRIFSKHGIPTALVNEHYLPKVGAARNAYPARRTRVSSAIGATALAGGIVSVSVARLVLKRRRRGIL